MKLEEHDVYGMDDTGRPGLILAHVKPASAESVVEVLGAGEDDPEGRSNWMWVRLANGDLILGVYPQGDTYFSTEQDHC